MCGITGFTSKNWEPPPDRIRAATSTLIHRGPDQTGVFESQLFSMGATRLKIIDLHGGDQPILSDDGDTGIVFNGEIYNHLELRRELGERGHRFTSHSDTETVLHAFLEWDKECFSRLRGMFAIALWCKSEKRIVLARDRMGIKPLYISRQGEDLFFGSELKAIFAHPEIERGISLAGLDCYLSLNYVPCPWTLVDGIEKLPPGCWLEWRDGQVTSDSYWRLPFGPSERWTLNSAKEELDSLMQSALREHLLSDVPLGVWLSGGIDSSAILHYAAQASSSQLKTFSISFRGRKKDVNLSRTDAGPRNTMSASTSGTRMITQRFQNQTRYNPPTTVASQILRVSPSSRAMTSNSAHVIHGQSCLSRLTGPKKMKAASMSKTNISSPPNVIQWLIAPVILSPV